MIKKIAPFAFVFLMMGCVAPQLDEFKINTYQDANPIGVKVDNIVVSSEIEHFERLPHIEDEMPITPEAVLKEWADNRFYATQSKKINTMHIVIKKAYMTKTIEKSDNWYTFDNELYKLSYDIKVNYISGEEIIYTQNVGGFESSSLPKKNSLADKEEIFEKMMNQMVKKVNDKILVQMPREVLSKGY